MNAAAPWKVGFVKLAGAFRACQGSRPVVLTPFTSQLHYHCSSFFAPKSSSRRTEKALSMQPNGSLTSNPDLAKGLPPVMPPSGKFIAQLFLVPFIIVACLIGFALFVKWFAGSALSPEGYLERLDSPNKDVRWRAAETLAQVLLRDDQLASNPRFVLDLADHLRRAWQANQSEERALAEQLRKQSKIDDEQAQEALRPGRNYLLYLSACLGNVMLPIGAPVLSELALSQQGSDPRS